MKSGKQQARKKKKHNWTTSTVLGLILGALGLVGLIELRDQISISPLELELSSQPFTAPFRITNTGYLAVHIVTIECDTLDVESATFSVKNEVVRNPLGQNWKDFDLDRGESKTIICSDVLNGSIPITKADIIILIRHRPFLFPFGSIALCSRWVGMTGDHWQWTNQPVSELPGVC